MSEIGHVHVTRLCVHFVRIDVTNTNKYTSPVGFNDSSCQPNMIDTLVLSLLFDYEISPEVS